MQEEKENQVAASARPHVSGTCRNPQVKRGKQTTCKRRHQFSLLFTGTLVKVSPTDGSSTCPLMTRLAHLMKEFRAFLPGPRCQKSSNYTGKTDIQGPPVRRSRVSGTDSRAPIPFMRTTRRKRKIERARPETDL